MRRLCCVPKRWLVKRRWLVVLEAITYVYKDIWAAALGEVLVCSRETANTADRYAVAILYQG